MNENLLQGKALCAAPFVLLASLVETMKRMDNLKRYCLMACMAMMALVGNAHPVDLDTAREVGAKFLNGCSILKTDDPANLQLVKTYRTANNDAAFYVFNTTDGFVIVSADDCATPILGYSNESVFTVDDVPVQMEAYLQQFVKQIQFGIENSMVADEATTSQWELVRATGFINEERGAAAVAPLLTDTWGQGCFYNNNCPADANGQCGHVLTGCVATSFSQILHYWGYPVTGTGSHTYTPEGYPQQTANYGETTYQWNNMPNSLSSSSSSTQVNAVATLMWHCGVAVEMSYGVQGSSANSADILPALVNYFNYSTDATIVYRNNYTSSQWLTLIKNCLNLSRPVHYRGTDDNGGSGHAFVCDGYDSNNYLHFNWGWYGNCNNYFADGALNPDVYAFNTNNAAIINIHPILPSYQVTISSNPSDGGTVAFGTKGDREVTTYDFENGTMMNWTSLDADGDGYGWVSSTDPGQYHNNGVNLAGSGHDASQAYMISGSWSNSAGIPLTPDNYLISPIKAAYSSINFYVCAQDINYPAEHFGIAVSTLGNSSASDFTTVQEWTLTVKESGAKSIGRNGDSKDQGSWYNYNVDLSAYAGQEIWVAIRHFNCTDQFILNVDDISLTTGGGGGGNSSSAYFEQGQLCTVTATPANGYYFSNWTDNGTVVSNSASYTFNVNGTCNLVANFTTEPLPQYSVNITSNPSNGGTVAFDASDYYDFEDGTMQGWTTIDADGDGYNWVLASTGMGTGYGHNGSSDLVYSQSYDNTYGVLYPDNYLVSPAKSEVGFITFYACGQDASYVAEHFGVAVSTGDATPADFTTIQEWTMTAKSVGAHTNMTRGGSRTQGTWYEYTVDLSAYAGQEIWVAIRHFNCSDMFYLDIDDVMLGRVSGSTGCASFEPGQSCTVTATANNSYTFTNWTENGTAVSNNSSYTFTVNSNRTLVANFTQIPSYIIMATADPVEGGVVSGGDTYEQGAVCSLSATPNPGYEFVNWTKNGTAVSSNPSFSFTVTGNASYVAHFIVQTISFTITATADPVEGGVVSGGGNYEQGAVCSLSATPNLGFRFVNWTKNGTVVSTNNSFSFNVLEDASYVAHFIPVYTITVSTNPVEGGVVIGGGTYDHGSQVTVEVTPNDHYVFVNWTENGEEVSQDMAYTFTATGNRQLVAQLSYVTDIEESDARGLSVYPNPAHDKLFVESGSRIACFELYAIDGTWLGRVEADAMKTELSLAHLPSGMYLVKVIAQDQVATVRFIKE